MGDQRRVRARLGAINATTGAIDTTLNVGPTLPRVNSMWVQKLDVSPDGTKLAIIGNFLAVGGMDRKQIALIDLTTSPATVANWSTEGYSAACASVFWTYIRDIEFSPDSSYFAVVTTGGPNGMTLCDTTARLQPQRHRHRHRPGVGQLDRRRHARGASPSPTWRSTSAATSAGSTTTPAVSQRRSGGRVP